MELSVVVPTLNGRDRLSACLDSLTEHVPDATVIVVNGPSSDGTTGMVRDRDDVDVLLEIADRNVNVARNAGITAATTDHIAIVHYDTVVQTSWQSALVEQFEAGHSFVTGPTRGEAHCTGAGFGIDANAPQCNPDTMAFSRTAIEALDGFDELLSVGGTADLCHRLKRQEFTIARDPNFLVHRECSMDGGRPDQSRRDLYRDVSYRLVKNYGLRPLLGLKTGKDAVVDAITSALNVVRGSTEASEWVTEGRSVCRGLYEGTTAGLRVRYAERSTSGNPHGLSANRERVIQKYDWR